MVSKVNIAHTFMHMLKLSQIKMEFFFVYPFKRILILVEAGGQY